jgi:hypothetical protein
MAVPEHEKMQLLKEKKAASEGGQEQTCEENAEGHEPKRVQHASATFQSGYCGMVETDVSIAEAKEGKGPESSVREEEKKEAEASVSARAIAHARAFCERRRRWKEA